MVNSNNSEQAEKENGLVDFISGQPLRATPEECQAVQPFARKLVEDYGYPKEMIQTRPQWHVKVRPSDVKKEYPVDIAVFSSPKHSDNSLYLIVECKKKTRKDGLTQLEDYMRLSKAVLGVWFNGKETLYIRKYEKQGEIIFLEIPNIPLYGQRIEDVGLFKRKDLKRTHNLKSIFSNIRNYLAANNTGTTLDNEFVTQIINLIFCKIYDERYTRPDDMVSFRAGIDEAPDKIARRILTLFQHVKQKYPDVFSETDVIKLSPSSIAYIAGELQQFCLIESERDAIADAFETFISPSLRGGQGQFFTPRNVVKLIISILNPSRWDRVIDPACGSGGFLIEALRHVWSKIKDEGEKLGWPEREIIADMQEVAIKNFRGIDKESFLSKTTKAYMAILGDGRGGIFCENSLTSPLEWENKAQSMIAMGAFDMVITNPPYGSKLKITDTSILERYELGHKWKTSKDAAFPECSDKLLEAQVPQVLFIERSLDLLKPGGKLGVVAPESMFCNPSHKYIMRYVEQHARIDAIISMPEDLFQPHTHAKTCVAILTKLGDEETVSPNHEIFMAIADWCGHDSRGLEVPYDDIPLIQQRYETIRKGENLEYDHLGFSIKQKDIRNSIYLPKYYNPEISYYIEEQKDVYDFVPVGDLMAQGLISCSTGDEVGKLAYDTGTIPFVRTSDIANWEIKLDPKQGLSEEIYNEKAKKQDVQPYDILMVRDGTYLVGTCALVLPSETKIVYQSHLYKIRSNDHEKLNPYLLLALLSSPIVKRQIRAKQFTQDIIDTLGGRIKELILPFPKSQADQAKIIEKVKAVFELRSKAKGVMLDVLRTSTPACGVDKEGSFITLI